MCADDVIASRENAVPRVELLSETVRPNGIISMQVT